MIKKKEKKTSWDYQKDRNYKQVKIMFDLDDSVDAELYHYLSNYIPNRTSYIKRLLYEEMVRYSDHG